MSIFWQYEQLRKQIEDELKYSTTKMVIPKDVYERHVLGIFDNQFLTGGGRCNGMSMIRSNYDEEYDDSIDFLFSTEKWNGSKISDMKSSYIVNTVLMLERKASMYKANYVMWIIDNMKSDNMKVPKDNAKDIMKMNALDWICSTPVFGALMDELKNRDLVSVLDMIREDRKANEANK